MFSRFSQKSQSGPSTIWQRYTRYIVPAVILLIILMDVIIYSVVARNSKAAMTEDCFRTVDLQCQNINQIFTRYIADMEIMAKEYHGDPDAFVQYAGDFTQGHINQYSYVRLTLPDGSSWTSLAGKDPNDARYRKLYKQIMEQGKNLSINNAHPTDLCDGEVFSISIPIKRNNANVAILTAVFPAEVIDYYLRQRMNESRSGFFALLDDNLMLRLYHGEIKSSSLENLVKMGFEGLDRTILKGISDYQAGKHTCTGNYKTPDNYTMVCHYQPIGDTGWFITLNMPLLILNMDIIVTSVALSITGILTILVVLLIIRIITKRVVMEPLKSINKVSKDIANGKLYSTILDAKLSDDELGETLSNIGQMQQKLHSVVESLRNSTNVISDCSKSIKDTVSHINEDVQLQSASVDNIKESIDNMNSLVLQNADLAATTKEYSDQIEQDIDMITKASDNTRDTLQNVISKVKIINEISSRTDLLAINAAVEAARAGDNGTGFAVVAAEIRKLAERCQRASVEINQLSSESLLVTQQTAELVQDTIPKVRENTEKISRISASCNEQLMMTQNISQAINQLADITASHSKSSDDTKVYTQTLYSNMENLNQYMDFFRLDGTAEQRRMEIASEIQQHTSEILKLKSKLLEVAESADDTPEADAIFHESVDGMEAVDSGQEASEKTESPEADAADGNTGSVDAAPIHLSAASAFRPKSNTGLDSEYESF